MERSFRHLFKEIFLKIRVGILPHTIQVEVTQGRLEALLNFQTLIPDLTGFFISNAFLLEEATAAAKVIHMLYESKPKDQIQSNKFFIF